MTNVLTRLLLGKVCYFTSYRPVRAISAWLQQERWRRRGRRRKRKREKRRETFATGEPRDDAADKENLARR
ncbi:hypothetical protein GW17_00000042 [Ensete ventricosum]|nr:hypothetical protein GW17_00000042 [Ensete ventricosum]